MSVRNIEPAKSAVSVAVNTVQATARAVYVGVAGDYDFAFDGTTTWIAFKGCAAGSILPLAATAARDNADGSAPAAGEIVFLY